MTEGVRDDESGRTRGRGWRGGLYLPEGRGQPVTLTHTRVTAPVRAGQEFRNGSDRKTCGKRVGTRERQAERGNPEMSPSTCLRRGETGPCNKCFWENQIHWNTLVLTLWKLK